MELFLLPLVVLGLVAASFWGDDDGMSDSDPDDQAPDNPLPTMPMPGDIILTGSSQADVLSGQDGDDFLNGKNGDDTLDGGAGNDQLFGEQGADILLGGAGDDVLTGGFGNDIFDGGAGANRINGGGGDDSFRVSDGTDIIYGGKGADTLIQTAGSTEANLGAGNDLAVVSGGDVTLAGGLGADRIFVTGGTFDIGGGFGTDVIQVSGGTGTISGAEGSDRLSGSGLVINGDNDDDFLASGNVLAPIANGAASMLFGGAGDDTLYSLVDGTTMQGGTGADLIIAARDALVTDFDPSQDQLKIDLQFEGASIAASQVEVVLTEQVTNNGVNTLVTVKPVPGANVDSGRNLDVEIVLRGVAPDAVSRDSITVRVLTQEVWEAAVVNTFGGIAPV